jgi:hypothetical protein
MWVNDQSLSQTKSTLYFCIKVLDKVLQPLKITGTRQHHKSMGPTYVPEVQGLGVIELFIL